MFGELRFFADLGGQYTEGLGGDNYKVVGLSVRGAILVACAIAALGAGGWYYIK